MLDRFLANLGTVKCVLPWVGFNVETNEGDVHPCCKDWSIRSYGNIRRSSIQEIRNSLVARRHRQAMLDGQIEDYCRSTCPKIKDRTAGRDAIERVIRMGGAWTRNARKALAEIDSGATWTESVPILFQVMTTSYCNLRCTMCTQSHEQRGHLPSRFYEELQGNLNGAFRITLLGGEVLTDPWSRVYLLSLTRECLGDTRLGLVTNGLLLDPVLRPHLDRYNFDFLIVSVNASCPETYTRVHGRNGFSRVVRNIRAIRDEQTNLPLFASFVVQPDNHKDLSSFIDLFTGMGVPMKFVPVANTSGSMKSTTMGQIAASIWQGIDRLAPIQRAERDQLLHVQRVLAMGQIPAARAGR